jgi:hypothetical protein
LLNVATHLSSHIPPECYWLSCCPGKPFCYTLVSGNKVGARRETHTENPTISDTNVQNIVHRATLHLGFMHSALSK